MEFVSETFVKDTNLEKDQLDGKFLNCSNCTTTGMCADDKEGTKKPGKKKKPKHGQNCTRNPMPEILYLNGINTTPEQNCATSQGLADTMCANVVSYYNATYGTTKDGAESFDNIAKMSDNRSPDNPAFGLEEYLRNNEGKEINIVAHSQGGLITRHALRSIANANEHSTDSPAYPLENIKVISAGTAEGGWPEGPSYTQYTNTQDIVPKLIADIDAKTGILPDPPQLVRRRFTSFFSDWKLGHSMDDVYLPAMKRELRRKEHKLCPNCPNHYKYERPSGMQGRMY